MIGQSNPLKKDSYARGNCLIFILIHFNECKSYPFLIKRQANRSSYHYAVITIAPDVDAVILNTLKITSNYGFVNANGAAV